MPTITTWNFNTSLLVHYMPSREKMSNKSDMNNNINQIIFICIY